MADMDEKIKEGRNQNNSQVNTSFNESNTFKTFVSDKGPQIKCPKCGSTDISLSSKDEQLICNFCRYEFDPERIIPETIEDLRKLEGEIIGLGAQDIIADVEDVLTFKCSSCGAEVVIDTRESVQARCHWCRNILSVNQQIPNGSIPDMLLPFKLKKDEAKTEIEKFVKKRKFFALPKFKEEFSSQNIMGVYLPYMVVDINAHSIFSGQGEHQIRKYYVGGKDDMEECYDADLYSVEREFDLLIDDFTIESTGDKLNYKSSEKTNNIINTIMPFDTENSVKWNANYLKGFSLEKRDVNIERLKANVNHQIKNIARNQANNDLKQYDRGVKWSKERVDIKGQQWKAAYLPVWLYSYQEIKNKDENLLHYVAVNARTKEIMGSVPINISKLNAASAIVGTIVGLFGLYLGLYFGIVIGLIIGVVFGGFWGLVFYYFMYETYRNKDARHYYETETKANIENLQKSDEFIKKLTELKNSRMQGANTK